MKEKRHYEAPSITVLWMDTRNSLLAGSVVVSDPNGSFEDDAALNGDFDSDWE